MRRIILAAAAAVIVAMTPALAATPVPKTYDKEIKSAAEKWLPGVPWKLLKAQYYQESRLNPNAVSPVGAAGVAQFMPATWRQVTKELGWSGIDSRLAGPAIEAGAYYMMEQRRTFRSLADWSRHKHALGGYNAGAGNIMKAAKLCGAPAEWEETVTCLPRVTGHHSAETKTYIERIWLWYRGLQ